MKILIQNVSTIETRAISAYCNQHEINFTRCSIEDVGIHHGCIPVGSVEFVTEYCKTFSITIPYFNPYPEKYLTLKYIDRKIETFDVGEIRWVPIPSFMKPVKTKLFNGFIFRGLDYSYEDEYDKEQINALMHLPMGEELYVSTIVDFVAEWRLYVINRELVAVARYDANDEEYDEDLMLNFASGPLNQSPYRTYCLDIGLLSDGSYQVVELNDAWAIGKYKDIDNADYFRLLISRWCEIVMC